MTNNGSLYDTAPDLVKEWHPSANGMLTPTKVATDYADKVWWICSKSHEWRATIKSRLSSKGCPRCQKDEPIESIREEKNSHSSKNTHNSIDTPPRSSNEFSQLDVFNFNLGYYSRKTRRYEIKATAVVKAG